MDTEKKLSISMGIFFILVVAFFGYMIMHEKGNPLVKMKLEKKLVDYINNNYQDIISEVEISKLNYDHTYYIVVYNKKNKALSFKVTYSNKKIISTYKQDYVSGKSLTRTYERNLEEKIKCSEYSNVSVKFLKDLTKVDASTKKRLINNDRISTIPIYDVILTKKYKNVTPNKIKKLITNFYNHCNDKDIKAMQYSFKINDDIVINLVEDEILYRLDDIINDKIIVEKENSNE